MPLRMVIGMSMMFMVIVLIDLYAFKGFKMVTSDLSLVWRRISRYAFWLPTLVVGVLFIYSMFTFEKMLETKSYKFFFLMTGLVFTFLVPKIIFSLFHLVDDAVNLARIVVDYFSSDGPVAEGEHRINRLQFINQMGLVFSGIALGSMVYGQTKGKYAFKVRKESLGFKDLPESFNGLKVVQLSDLHLGSFLDNSFEEVKSAIKKINELDADYILFTGDMVNNYAYETKPWIEILSTIKAKKGKFSILGNHDYGDYVPWNSPEEKRQNMEDLYEAHSKMGFKLLLNQNELIEENGEQIAIVGVENWGKGFHQYGDLKKAMQGLDPDQFKILLSHDPTHWEKQVRGKENIQLTLSGHTHGMQFGIELPGIKVSPARLIYKHWAGLYSQTKQFLYVNRGFGFLGFPGRVGISPEITLLQLNRIA